MWLANTFFKRVFFILVVKESLRPASKLNVWHVICVKRGVKFLIGFQRSMGWKFHL